MSGGRKGKGLIVLGLFIITLNVSASALAFRANPQLQERMQRMRTVAIVPPRVRIYQLSIEGAKEPADEWTITAQQNMARAVETTLKGRAGLMFKPFPSISALVETHNELSPEALRTEIDESRALFEAVSASAIQHTYIAADRFSEKLTYFDYSLGPEVERLAKLVDADALLFVSGVDHISTGGRKALLVLGTLAGAAGGAFTGVYLAPKPGTARLTAALVDATTGAILWYDAAEGTYDLRNLENATSLAGIVFYDFPRKSATK